MNHMQGICGCPLCDGAMKKEKEKLSPRMKLARRKYMLETRLIKKVMFNWYGRKKS